MRPRGPVVRIVRIVAAKGDAVRWLFLAVVCDVRLSAAVFARLVASELVARVEALLVRGRGGTREREKREGEGETVRPREAEAGRGRGRREREPHAPLPGARGRGPSVRRARGRQLGDSFQKGQFDLPKEGKRHFVHVGSPSLSPSLLALFLAPFLPLLAPLREDKRGRERTREREEREGEVARFALGRRTSTKVHATCRLSSSSLSLPSLSPPPPIHYRARLACQSAGGGARVVLGVLEERREPPATATAPFGREGGVCLIGAAGGLSGQWRTKSSAREIVAVSVADSPSV